VLVLIVLNNRPMFCSITISLYKSISTFQSGIHRHFNFVPATNRKEDGGCGCLGGRRARGGCAATSFSCLGGRALSKRDGAPSRAGEKDHSSPSQADTPKQEAAFEL